jgi:hypothetical protein
MCRAKPGDRCSYHQRIVLMNQLRARQKTFSELTSVNESLENDSSATTSSPKLIVRQTVLRDKVSVMDDKLGLAELEYNATPDGRRDLEDKISTTPDGPQKDRLLVDLHVAKKRREWQQTTSQRLDDIEAASGTEKAIIEAEIERGKAVEAQKKLALQEVAARNAILAEQHKERRLRSRQRMARLRKIQYRARQLQRVYRLCTGDLDSFIKRKTKALGMKYSRRTASWFFGAIKAKYDEKDPMVN